VKVYYYKVMIGIIGLGFVGTAIYKSLVEYKGCSDIVGYDRYKKFDWSVKSLKGCLDSDMLFLCLPTLYNTFSHDYDYSALEIVLRELDSTNYKGVIIIKSTIIPGTVERLEKICTNLNIIHNPEFLRERCSVEDVNNQQRVILGKGDKCSDEMLERVVNFYNKYYPTASIKIVEARESEALKIYINTFCSVKIQILNELSQLSGKIGVDYDVVKDMMIDGNWMGPRHTSVPGYDGKPSYGGHCLPKDSRALLSMMKRVGATNYKVLEASITERDEMRESS